MEIEAYSGALYLTAWGDPKPPDAIYQSHHYIKALKGKPLSGTQMIPVPQMVDGEWITITEPLNESNRALAFEWFPKIMLSHAEMAQLFFAGSSQISLVPIPGSKCDSVAEVENSNTHRMAQALALLTGARVEPVLHFKEKLASAHGEGGPRSPAALYPHIVTHQPSDARRTYYLVDDVLTSGGHIAACAAALWHQQLISVPAAICAGRARQAQEADPWALEKHRIERYDPEPKPKGGMLQAIMRQLQRR